MDKNDIDLLERLRAEATPGPWEENVWYSNDGGFAAVGPRHEAPDEEPDEPGSSHWTAAKADARLICALVRLAPQLIAAAKAQACQSTEGGVEMEQKSGLLLSVKAKRESGVFFHEHRGHSTIEGLGRVDLLITVGIPKLLFCLPDGIVYSLHPGELMGALAVALGLRDLQPGEAARSEEEEGTAE